jgi:hypothetical protein
VLYLLKDTTVDQFFKGKSFKITKEMRKYLHEYCPRHKEKNSPEVVIGKVAKLLLL